MTLNLAEGTATMIANVEGGMYDRELPFLMDWCFMVHDGRGDKALLLVHDEFPTLASPNIFDLLAAPNAGKYLLRLAKAVKARLAFTTEADEVAPPPPPTKGRTNASTLRRKSGPTIDMKSVTDPSEELKSLKAPKERNTTARGRRTWHAPADIITLADGRQYARASFLGLRIIWTIGSHKNRLIVAGIGEKNVKTFAEAPDGSQSTELIWVKRSDGDAFLKALIMANNIPLLAKN